MSATPVGRGLISGYSVPHGWSPGEGSTSIVSPTFGAGSHGGIMNRGLSLTFQGQQPPPTSSSSNPMGWSPSEAGITPTTRASIAANPTMYGVEGPGGLLGGGEGPGPTSTGATSTGYTMYGEGEGGAYTTTQGDGGTEGPFNPPVLKNIIPHHSEVDGPLGIDFGSSGLNTLANFATEASVASMIANLVSTFNPFTNQGPPLAPYSGGLGAIGHPTEETDEEQEDMVDTFQMKHGGIVSGAMSPDKKDLPTVRMMGGASAGYHPGQYGATGPMPGSIEHYQRYGTWSSDRGEPGGMVAPGSMGYHGRYGTFGDVTSPNDPSKNPHLKGSTYNPPVSSGNIVTESGPTQTLGLGEVYAPPEGYRHGIDPQWNYFTDAGQITTADVPTVESRHGYNPAMPTVRAQEGFAAVDSGPFPTHGFWPLMNQMPFAQQFRDFAQEHGTYNPKSRGVSMNRGGMVDDAMRLQNAGTGDHNRLVHMTQGEVDAMNQLARAGIGGLRANGMAINPETGLPEAGLFSSILPMIAGLGATISTGGAASPLLLGAASAGGSLLGQAIEGEGIDLGKTFLAGLGGWGAGQLGQTLGGAAEAANAATIAQPATNVAGGTLTQVGTEAAGQTIGSGVNIPAGVMGSSGQNALQSQIMNTPANLTNVGANVGRNLSTGFVPEHLQADLINQNLLGAPSIGAGMPQAVDPFQSLISQATGPDAVTQLSQTEANRLAAQYGVDATQDAAMREAGVAAFRANPSIDAVTQGAGMWDPTSWASSPGTVGLKETLAPGGAVLASAGDAFGAFDPPEYDWGDTDIGGYVDRGPYLPRRRDTIPVPADYQHGIDPAYQYYSYANEGGYVDSLPQVKARLGYGRYAQGQPQQMNPVQQQQQQGLGFLTNLGQGAGQSMAAPQSIYSIDAATALANAQKQRPMPTRRMEGGTRGQPSGRFANQIARGDKLYDVRDRNTRFTPSRWEAMKASQLARRMGEEAARAETPRQLGVLGGAAARLAPFVVPSKPLNVGEVGEVDQRLIDARAEKARRVQEVMNRPPFVADASAVNLPMIGKAQGGVAGEPVNIAADGLMAGADPAMQAAVAERDMVSPSLDQPQNPEERAVYDMALLALQGQLEPEEAQEAITEFIDVFGPEAYRMLEELVNQPRDSGGLVKPANGETTVGMTEQEAMAQQGPDVIPGKIVDPQTGEQTANLRVGEDEYIEPADSLSRRAMAAGMAPTPHNGAMVRGMEEDQLRAIYG